MAKHYNRTTFSVLFLLKLLKRNQVDLDTGTGRMTAQLTLNKHTPKTCASSIEPNQHILCHAACTWRNEVLPSGTCSLPFRVSGQNTTNNRGQYLLCIKWVMDGSIRTFFHDQNYHKEQGDREQTTLTSVYSILKLLQFFFCHFDVIVSQN